MLLGLVMAIAHLIYAPRWAPRRVVTKRRQTRMLFMRGYSRTRVLASMLAFLFMIGIFGPLIADASASERSRPTPRAGSRAGVTIRGETPPRGYGVEPCATMVFDMATAKRVYTEAEFDWHTNLIGCEQDGGGVYTLHQYSSVTGDYLPCNVAAYTYAARWLMKGNAILALKPDTAFKQHMRKQGCKTLFEDWSWAD